MFRFTAAERQTTLIGSKHRTASLSRVYPTVVASITLNIAAATSGTIPTFQLVSGLSDAYPNWLSRFSIKRVSLLVSV